MTVTEITEEVAYRTGVEVSIAHGFVQTFIDILCDHVESGAEVKIRGLGTFKWTPSIRKLTGVTQGLGSGPGYKLKFIPSGRFKKRRRLKNE